jgi:F-type H+-transporting ATPase subunit b
MSPPNASLILIMICFWVTFWLIRRFMIRPIWAVLSERQQRIGSAQREWKAKNDDYLSATTRLEAELEEAAREGARVRSELRQRALDDRQRRLGDARAAAEERLQAAVERLGVEAESARGVLRSRASELAQLLAGRLLGREVKS